MIIQIQHHVILTPTFDWFVFSNWEAEGTEMWNVHKLGDNGNAKLQNTNFMGITTHFMHEESNTSLTYKAVVSIMAFRSV